ncbi:MAG: hypothetical protein M3209_11655 [Acidobacteriota bacterium]|nr:hypothetical protein [Acidobacteriota bacterium]
MNQFIDVKMYFNVANKIEAAAFGMGKISIIREAEAVSFLKIKRKSVGGKVRGFRSW